jgi:hypothetical protein
MDFRIDEELRSLIPRLSREEYEAIDWLQEKFTLADLAKFIA